MAQKSTISITFKIAGDVGGFKQLSVDADGLRKVIGTAVVEAEKLKSSVVNFAALATSIDSVNKSFTDLRNVLSGLTNAHAAQIEAETKLAVNMRNTMGAREADIQSIKDLCAAQQELGIIGDEVQLAGAQELATYLGEKQSLERLIPVMNDMLAQQYGLNATQENAVQIATMLGKVMDGQTGALSRYGYSFDSVQEQILKYGTESQRAAVLSEVVSAAVGGMNAEFAKTDVGKQKQLENTLGDIKEQLGGLVQGAMPFVTIAANTMLALAGTLKFAAGVKTATAVIAGWNIKQKALNAAMFMGTGNMKKAAQAANIYSAAAKGSAASTTALKIAMRGLLITGIGIAIAALTAAIAYFALKTDEAAESTNKFLDAGERAKRDAEQLEQLRQQEASTLTRTRAALEINISKLKEFNGTKEQEKKLVNEMNNTYGDTMGYFSSVADWYNALISNSEAYCRQMVIEARTRMLANQIAEKEQEIHDIAYDENGNVRKYSKKRETRKEWRSANGWGSYMIDVEIEGSSAWEEAKAAIDANKMAVQNLRAQLAAVAKEAAEIEFKVKGSGKQDSPEGPKGTESVKTRLEEIRAERTSLKAKWLDASNEEKKSIEEQITALNKEEAVIDSAMRRLDKLGISTANNPIFNENASNLKEIGDNLEILQKRLQTATVEEAALTNQQIVAWQGKADAIRNAGKAVENNTSIFRADATTLAQITENISALSDQLNTATVEEAALINQQIQAWEKKADAIRNAGKEAKANFDTFRSGYGSIKGIGGGVESITDALEGNANAWQTVTGIVDGFLQIYDGIKTIVGIINMLTRATEDHKNAEIIDTAVIQGKTAATAAETAASVASASATATEAAAAETNTAAKSGEAIASAAASGAKMPFPMNLVAIAAGVAAVIGALAAIGSFATGGIVGGSSKSGDKLLARVNSGEMILNMTQQRNLFRMLNTPAVAKIPQSGLYEFKANTGFIQSITTEPVIIGGTLRASGREIVCVLANETRIASKSGRKTNIKL